MIWAGETIRPFPVPPFEYTRPEITRINPKGNGAGNVVQPVESGSPLIVRGFGLAKAPKHGHFQKRACQMPCRTAVLHP